MGDVFIYSSVSKCMSDGPLVLAKYATKSGDFPQVIARILEKLPPDDNEVMYEYSGYYFDILVENRLVFLCMTQSNADASELSKRFLREIKNRFQVKYGKAGDLVNESTSRDFESMLRDTMENYAGIDARRNQSLEIQKELGATRAIMHENIEEVLGRGSKIEHLVERTDTLSASSNKFHRKAKDMKRSFWCKNVKVTVMIVVFMVAVLYACGTFFCGGIELKKCL